MLKTGVTLRKIASREISNTVVLLSLTVICGIGLLRIVQINRSFWMDEITTSWVIGGTFLDIFKRCWINNLSPLYYTIIYMSKVVFGYSEFSLRIPGLMAGILSIPVIYLISHELTKSKILSLFCAFLSSIDYMLIFYSLDVRPYSLVIFFSLVHIYILLIFLRKNDRIYYSFILGLISGITILLHYTSVVFCFFEFIFTLIYLRREKRLHKKNSYALIIWAAIPIAMLIPFLPHIKYLLSNNGTLGSFIEKKDIFSTLILLPHFASYILLPLVISFIIEYAISSEDKIQNDVDKFSIILILSWYFIPILTNWILTETNIATIYLDRYLCYIIPAPIIGSMLALKFLKKQAAKLSFAALVIVLSTYHVYSYVYKIEFSHPNIKTIKHQYNEKTTYNPYGWKDSIGKINNLHNHFNKIYVYSGLVESNMLRKGNKYGKDLLRSYLLAPVDSIYKLKNSYLKIAEPISSIDDIPASSSNFLIINYAITKRFRKYTDLSPKDNEGIPVFYVKSLLPLSTKRPIGSNRRSMT